MKKILFALICTLFVTSFVFSECIEADKPDDIFDCLEIYCTGNPPEWRYRPDPAFEFIGIGKSPYDCSEGLKQLGLDHTDTCSSNFLSNPEKYAEFFVDINSGTLSNFGFLGKYQKRVYCDDKGSTFDGMNGARTVYCYKGDSSCTDCKAEEVACDGIDDDCDGQIDEGCACIDNETRPCGSTVGECSTGLQTCISGEWETGCIGSINPTDEICDTKDNDCDRQIDEENICLTGDPSFDIFDVSLKSNEIYVQISCTQGSNHVEIKIFDLEGNELTDLNFFDLHERQINPSEIICTPEPSKYILDTNLTQQTYKVVANLQGDCEVCSKKDYLGYINTTRESQIPDGGILTVLLVLLMSLFLIKNKND